MPMIPRCLSTAAVVLAFWSGGQRISAQTAPDSKEAAPQVDPKATDLLKRSCDYLESLQALSVRASFSEEVVLLDGQKIGYESGSKISLSRPNHFRTVRHGTKENLDFYYDGKTMTMFQAGPNLYAKAAAPPTLDGMIGTLESEYDVAIPGSDLFYTDAYTGMIEGVTDASYIGLEEVGGVPAHHLSFRKSDVDWQIWVEDGEKPVPVKYVITTKWVTGAPSYSVLMTDWDLSPKFDPSTFVFVPPSDARKIEFARPSDVPAIR